MPSNLQGFVSLKDFPSLPTDEKTEILNNNTSEVANALLMNLEFYRGKDFAAQKVYPFLTKKAKETIFNKFEERKRSAGPVHVMFSINFYGLFQNESFSPKLLKDIIHDTMGMDNTEFKRHQHAIGLLYSSTMFERGNNICDKRIIMDDFFCKQLMKKSENLLPSIATVVQSEDNIKILKKFKFKFNARDEITNIDGLAKKYCENNIFLEEMAIKTMGLSIPKENVNLFYYGINEEYHNRVRHYQHNASFKIQSKVLTHPIDYEFMKTEKIREAQRR